MGTILKINRLIWVATDTIRLVTKTTCKRLTNRCWAKFKELTSSSGIQTISTWRRSTLIMSSTFLAVFQASQWLPLVPCSHSATTLDSSVSTTSMPITSELLEDSRLDSLSDLPLATNFSVIDRDCTTHISLNVSVEDTQSRRVFQQVT